MSMLENTIERIPISAGLARKLGMVAESARRRVWVALAGVCLPLWMLIFFSSQSDGLTLLAAGLFATTFVGGIAVAPVVVTQLWAGRIGLAPFIIRERGRFVTRGALAAWLNGQKSEDSIHTALGRVRLDDADDAEGLRGVRAMLKAKLPGYDQIQIDYTPHRYLLSASGSDGGTLFARAGYVPPPSPPSVAPITGHELRRLLEIRLADGLRLVGLGLGCAIGLAAYVVMLYVALPADSPAPTSPVSTLIVVALLVGTVFFLAWGLYRLTVIACRQILRSARAPGI